LYSFHYCLPIIILGITFIHLAKLHEAGSTNPVGVNVRTELGTFSPYFVYKDVFAICVSLIFFGILVFYYPNALGHPDNYTKANPLVTPAHIVPE